LNNVTFFKEYKQGRTFMGKLPHNSDLLAELTKFCTQNNVRNGQLCLVGATISAKLGYYSQTLQKYTIHEGGNLSEGMEIVSCSGNISIKDDNPFCHVHIVLADKDGKTYGGHLMSGTIIYAAEFVIKEFLGENLTRGLDDVTKLPLWS